MTDAETKACPWCGETILAVAKKRKHCGEFLTVEAATETGPVQCAYCETTQQVPRDATSFHCSGCQRTIHAVVCPKCGEESQFEGGIERQSVRCPYCQAGFPTPASVRAAPTYTGSIGTRQKLSEVGHHSDGGLQCPSCGSTQFTAKRSMTGKLVGTATLGVGGLLAPKSQVKCVACGTMFKRG